MDKIKINSSSDDDISVPLSSDDISMLQHVLKSVKGSYPAEPYRQADFSEE